MKELLTTSLITEPSPFLQIRFCCYQRSIKKSRQHRDGEMVKRQTRFPLIDSCTEFEVSQFVEYLSLLSLPFVMRRNIIY